MRKRLARLRFSLARNIKVRISCKFPALILMLVTAQTARPQTGAQGGDFSNNSHAKKLPTGMLLVRGAWASASDSKTPLPEGGRLTGDVYRNDYFRLSFRLPPGWMQMYSGPPPSDSGYYVLGQFRLPSGTNASSLGTILISAQDLFFTLTPAANASELVEYDQSHLASFYKIEQPPTPETIANHLFTRFDYDSPAAQLHWYILATEIRCHMVEFVFTSRDRSLLQGLIRNMNDVQLPAEASPILGTGGDDVPVCIKDYATSENIIEKVDPVFTERRYNPIPVRIIIDKEGKVKHIHFLSAFPDQAKLIGDALRQWRFRPYHRNGQPVEVETGIMFGNAPRLPKTSSSDTVNE
jgi:hypothetical protein